MEKELFISIVYELETYNTNRARPYCASQYRLSKLASKYNCDLTPEEHENCNKGTTVNDEEKCNTKMLECVIILEGAPMQLKNKVIECGIQLHGHNGSVFDTWNISNF